MADRKKLVFLIKFAEGVSGIYSAISKNINDVVAVLNVVEGDSTIRKHIKQIIASLAALKSKIVLEEGMATRENLMPLFRILKKQIADIKELEAYLQLAKAKPNHKVIKTINDLNVQLTNLFAAEQAELGNAA